MVKNNFILKSISLLLSFWMLMASTGFSVNFHYCEGEIVNWSILNDADPCDHKEVVKSCCDKETIKKCHNPSEEILEKSDCCSSDQTTMELGSDFNFQTVEFEITLPQFIILSQFIISVSVNDQDIIELKEYEVPVLFYRQEAPFIQSFLI
jgi:hypothetical protein